ncbi:MAG: hypothetical protein ACJAV1_003774 [Paraglaciecola sp.]|jgi:hypothetical protein
MKQSISTSVNYFGEKNSRLTRKQQLILICLLAATLSATAEFDD